MQRTEQRTDLFAKLSEDTLKELFAFLLDIDLYFFARTGNSIYLMVTQNTFWQSRVKNILPADVSAPLHMAFPKHGFFAIQVLEKLYQGLNADQIQCFIAARANDLPRITSLKQFLTLQCCSAKNSQGQTFPEVVRKYGSLEMRQFVFAAVYKRIQDEPHSFITIGTVRSALVELGIQLDLGEGDFEKVLMLTRNSKVTQVADTSLISSAIHSHSLNSLKMLLSHYSHTEEGNDSKESNNASFTMLYQHVVKVGTRPMMEIFLEYGAEFDRPCFHSNHTPLEAAAEAGNLSVVQFLLENGAHINFGHLTPLYTAMRSGHKHIVQFLLEHGANVHLEPTFKYEQRRGYTGFTKNSLLTIGATFNRLGCMTILFEHCQKNHITFNVNEVDDKGVTPLFVAAEFGHAAMCELLLKNGASTAKRYKMATPLFIAAANGHLDVVKLLFAHQAALEHIGPNCHSAITTAAEHGHEQVVEFLCQSKQCNINIERPSHTAPLLIACNHQRLKVMQVLLQNGADVNYIDKYCNTALLCIVKNFVVNKDTDTMGILSLLIQYKADVNRACKNGFTPLQHVAKSYRINDEEMRQVMELLVKAGADPLVRHNGKTTLMMVSNSNAKTIDYLREAMKDAELNREDYGLDFRKKKW